MSARLESVGLKSVYKATPATVGGVRCKPDRAMDPAYITIHNTANPNADALDHYNAQTKGHLGSMQMAVHYYVDDKGTIYQCLRDKEQGWHAGDGRGPGNSTSISIEVCEKTGSDQAKAEEHAAALTADLIIQRGIPADHVVPHKHWTGKNCPHLILPHWDAFLAQVRYYLDLFQGRKPEDQPGALYRVQVGAYTVEANAVAQRDRLRAAGYADAFIIHADGWYKVQVGAFSVKANAERLRDELVGKGYEAIIV